MFTAFLESIKVIKTQLWSFAHKQIITYINNIMKKFFAHHDPIKHFIPPIKLLV